MDHDYYADLVGSLQDSVTPSLSLTASSHGGSPHSLDATELFPAEWLTWPDALESTGVQVIEPELLSLGKRKLSASDLEMEAPVDETAPPPGKQGRTSHNVIEKRYRSNLNDKILDLRDAVPHLAQEAFQDSSIKQPKGRIIACATAYIKQLEASHKLLTEQNKQLERIVTRKPTTGERAGKLAIGALAGVAALSGLQEHDSGRTTHALGAVPLMQIARQVAPMLLLATALWFCMAAVRPASRKKTTQQVSLQDTFQTAEAQLGVQQGPALLWTLLMTWLLTLLRPSTHVKTLCEAQVLGADLQLSRWRVLLFACMGQQSAEVRIMQLVILLHGLVSPETIRRLASVLPKSSLLSSAKLLDDAMQAAILQLAYGESSPAAEAVRQAHCTSPAEAFLILYAELQREALCRRSLLSASIEATNLSALLALPLPASSPTRIRILLYRALLDPAHFADAAEAMQKLPKDEAARHVNLFRCAIMLHFNKTDILLRGPQQLTTDTPTLLAYFLAAEQASGANVAQRRHRIYLLVRIWALRQQQAAECLQDTASKTAAQVLGRVCVQRITALFADNDSAYETS